MRPRGEEEENFVSYRFVEKNENLDDDGSELSARETSHMPILKRKTGEKTTRHMRNVTMQVLNVARLTKLEEKEGLIKEGELLKYRCANNSKNGSFVSRWVQVTENKFRYFKN